MRHWAFMQSMCSPASRQPCSLCRNSCGGNKVYGNTGQGWQCGAEISAPMELLAKWHCSNACHYMSPTDFKAELAVPKCAGRYQSWDCCGADVRISIRAGHRFWSGIDKEKCIAQCKQDPAAIYWFSLLLLNPVHHPSTSVTCPGLPGHQGWWAEDVSRQSWSLGPEGFLILGYSGFSGTCLDRNTAGGREYHLPVGWKRFAVQVKGAYDDGTLPAKRAVMTIAFRNCPRNMPVTSYHARGHALGAWNNEHVSGDNGWLREDESGWAVAYHGTSKEGALQWSEMPRVPNLRCLGYSQKCTSFSFHPTSIPKCLFWHVPKDLAASFAQAGSQNFT